MSSLRRLGPAARLLGPAARQRCLPTHTQLLRSRAIACVSAVSVNSSSVAAALRLPLALSSRLLVATAAAATAAATVAATADKNAACASAVPARCLVEADKLFDANQYDSLAGMLRGSLARAPDETELLWRLARACKKLSDKEKPKSAAKEALVREGLGHAARALAAAEKSKVLSGAVHKWYAILLSNLGEFTGTSETIKNSFVVREHFARACQLSPADATARHLLGLWCFEVSRLSWFEQKAAAALFASPPTSSFEEALGHFEAAEAMEPGFYPKNLLLLATTCSKLGRTADAKAWLSKCLSAECRTPEDEETLEEAKKLKV